MQFSEADYVKLQLEHSKLKKAFLEIQSQLIQTQHQLVTQEVEKFENELSIVESKPEEKVA